MSGPLDLGLLRTFTTVVDAGGFTRAAERIHLTQSTVSLQIKKLEEELGHALLLRDRTTGSVRTTEEGELLLGYARRLLDISAEAARALARPARAVTVRLGVPEDFAGNRLVGLLSAFAGSAPDIRLNTISGWSLALRQMLERGEIDLALVKREAGDGTAIAHWPEELVWVQSAGAGGIPEAGGEVPLALFPPGCIYRDRAIRVMEAEGYGWHVAYSSQGLMGVQAAVAGGLGLSLLPGNAVLPGHRVLAAGAFAPQRGTELALISRPERQDAPVRALADFLVGHIGGMYGAPV
ncbi:LysR family transcriptional regulator [Radicibacter daui]|uniref:LysR family transcriptional regulator n=1 Tax=Radicibacter daui TaxID=3064829 RepID=UPI004046FD02